MGWILRMVMVLLVVWASTDIFSKGDGQNATNDNRKYGVSRTADSSLQQLTTNGDVNAYFIVQYIRARENYMLYSLAENYNIVRIMSEPSKVYVDFVSAADPNNPKSNAAQLGRNGSRRIKINSVAFPQPQLAEVHFVIKEENNNMATPAEYSKVASVGFEYVRMNLTMDERFINPLGFRVIQYEVKDDVQNGK